MTHAPETAGSPAGGPLTPARKGASRTADIPADILAALSRGEMSSATLTESLAIDQATLADAVFPALPPAARQAVAAACGLGILKRMSAIAAVLHGALGDAALEATRTHSADTVRGWACFMIGLRPADSLAQRLDEILPLADDGHFGVREWAWMAVRPHLAAELPTAIDLLAGWAIRPEPRLRRFASEALRPRGVWCAHITPLKRQPEQILPILAALKADPSPYVQDSVANWLNDAAKDQPGWVRDLCRQWLDGDADPATRRICARAMRSLPEPRESTA